MSKLPYPLSPLCKEVSTIYHSASLPPLCKEVSTIYHSAPLPPLCKEVSTIYHSPLCLPCVKGGGTVYRDGGIVSLFHKKSPLLNKTFSSSVRIFPSATAKMPQKRGISQQKSSKKPLQKKFLKILNFF